MADGPPALHFRCASCGGINRIPADRLAAGPHCGRCKAPIDTEAHPAEVDDDQLDRLVASSPVPVLVDFWAPWCGPCRMVAPELVTLARAHAGRLVVVKVNTDLHQRTAGRLGVQAIPTLAVWKGGHLQKSQAGALMGAQLRAFVQPVLAS
jgi:thioredoxin 2